MKIAYVTVLSAEDPLSWSGLNRSIADCLRAQGLEVVLVGPLFDRRRAFLSKVESKLRSLATGRRHLWTRNLSLLRFYGRKLAQELARVDCDLIFSPATEALAYLPDGVRQPVVFWTDAPMAAMVDYYPWYTGLAPRCLAESLATDTRLFQRASLVCFSSEWAAQSAIAQHGVAPHRIAILPFGPNLDTTVAEAEIPAVVAPRLQPPWRFLFVGVDWVRKGGALAVAVVAELNRRGHPARLDVVGCTPPGPVPDFVKLHGFVSRREPAGRAQLAALFRRATFFLLPTLADATPVVFCEALAHALPCLGTRTGGVPSVVRDGVTGHLFAPAARATEWADRIIESARAGRYEAMARAAQCDSATRLNWAASGARLKSLLPSPHGSRPPHELHRLSSVA